LWVGTTKGVYVFNVTTRKLKTIHTTRNADMKSDKVAFLQYFKPINKLYVGTDRGIVEIKDGGEKWKTTNKGERFIAATERIDGMRLLSNEELWLVYTEGKRGRWQPQGLRKGLFKGEVNDLTLDKNDNLYIASDILIRYNPYKDRLDKYGENLGLVASKCLSLASDNQGALWLGTADAGLFRIYEDEIDLQELLITTILENPITCPGEMDGKIKVDVTGGLPPYKYSWERVRLKNNDNPTNLHAGTYKVTVEDAVGNTQFQSIKIDDPDPITVEVISREPVSVAGKKDGKATITITGGTPPYDIVWEHGEKGNKVRKLNYGYNYFQITDANGCELREKVNISKPKIIPELDIAKIRVGQTLQLNKLYFLADSTSITNESYEVLYEIYEFMKENDKVVIEIGGHTNNIPEDEYCNRLSTARAKAVAEFLYDKGITQKRISYKGYGKRKPIASNDSYSGRKKNQRVELKILQVTS